MSTSAIIGDMQGNHSASSVAGSLQRRFIQPDIAGASWEQGIEDPHNEIPLLGTILRGIAIGKSHLFFVFFYLVNTTCQGHLSLHYARWEYYEGTSDAPAGLVAACRIIHQFAYHL
jgi:hypothetical protein